MTDDLNRTVKIPENVTRAISLAPNLTEIVFAVGAGEKIVGRTSFDNFPPEAEKIQTVGDTLNPNIENIIALKPQVVLVSTASQIETFTKTLESQGITVFVTNPNSLDEIYKSIEKIGEIFGQKEKAIEVVNSLKKRVEKVEERTRNAEKIKVFVQIDKSLYTIGKESFLTDLIEKAGGISVTKDIETAYPKISKETALALNPDVIILSDSADNNEPNEVFKNSNAVKNNRVYKINADILSRPAPRIIDALEQIAEKLY
jgi:iron complex transport system substrate-binding protein